MTWDYPEVNVFGDLTAGAVSLLGWTTRYIEHESSIEQDVLPAICHLGDAARISKSDHTVDAVVTDPPYFDAIAYADLSDFFYIWLKRWLIDQLHHAMQLWKEENRADLVRYLREHDLIDHAPFWKLAQALFEVLPRGPEEDCKLVSALLGERETLRIEARHAEEEAEPPAQPTLFGQ